MSCNHNSRNVSGPNVVGESKVYGDINEYIIDGHEYIKMGYGLSHSGSCKKCREELESTIRMIIREENSR